MMSARRYLQEKWMNGCKEFGMKILKYIGTFLIYLIMFALVCIFFTGNGSFIYEAF